MLVTPPNGGCHALPGAKKRIESYIRCIPPSSREVRFVSGLPTCYADDEMPKCFFIFGELVRLLPVPAIW